MICDILVSTAMHSARFLTAYFSIKRKAQLLIQTNRCLEAHHKPTEDQDPFTFTSKFKLLTQIHGTLRLPYRKK